MNLVVRREDAIHSAFTGGECAAVTTEISIDTTLPPVTQRGLIIHAILESYCCSWPHGKIDELEELIQEGLDLLEKLQDEDSNRPK